MNENGPVTYPKDKNETVPVLLSDRQVQCLCEQIAYQTARGVSSESDGLTPPISLHWLTVLVHPRIYRQASESDWTMSSGRIRDAQRGLVEGSTGRSVT